MKNNSDLRRQLEGALRESTTAAARKVLSSEPSEDELKRAEEIDRLLKHFPASDGKTLYAAGLVGAICLVIASILWTVKVPTTRMHLTLRSDSVTLELANQLDWSGHWDLGNALVRLQELSKLDLPPEFAASGELVGRAWLDIERGAVELTRLIAEKHELLIITKSERDVVQILSKNASLYGELEVYGDPIVTAGSAPGSSISPTTARFEVPGTFIFHDVGRPGIPARLQVTPKDTMVLRNISVRYLNFVRETEDAVKGPTFLSGIRDGRLTMSDTGEEVTLANASYLQLANATGLVTELMIGPEGTALSFEGKVQQVLLGPRGYERDLKPSLLVFLYHQQKIGFFWGSATFLWGLIWAGRTLLFK